MQHRTHGSSVLSNIFAVLAVLQVLGLNQGVLRNILLESVHCNPIQDRTGIKQVNPVFVTGFPCNESRIPSDKDRILLNVITGKYCFHCR